LRHRRDARENGVISSLVPFQITGAGEQARTCTVVEAFHSHLESAMATEPKTLNDMFHDMLKDVYYAEKQILKALPKMAKAAKSPELKNAFETHRTETEGHVERLSDVFEAIGKAPRSKTCDAILGILEEGKAVMEDYADSPALDAGLVASAQAVEHYEMTRYGTLKAWAQQLGHKEAVTLLDATLAEETKTDELLTKISSATNSAAVAKAKAA
jgi:ferritin-like metal-binding protein YciE